MAPILNEEEMSIDPYELLGLGPDSTEQQAQKAYRKLSLKCHPDRNPNNPAAAHQFHLISLSLSILTDPSKRSFLDSRLTESRAKAERTAAMDTKRRGMVEALLAREEEARKAKERRREEGVRLGEEERIKEEGKRLRERMGREREDEVERESQRAKQAKISTNGRASTNPSNGHHGSSAERDRTFPGAEPQPPIDPLDLTFSLQCPPFDLPSTLPPYLTSSTSLQIHFSNIYGPIAHVLLKPGTSASSSSVLDGASQEPPAKKAKKEKKPKGPTAVIEFAAGNWSGCWACWKDNEAVSTGSSGGLGTRAGSSKRIAAGSVLRWGGGEEPAWVGWAERRYAQTRVHKEDEVPDRNEGGARATSTNGKSGADPAAAIPRFTSHSTSANFPSTFPTSPASTFPSQANKGQTTTAPARNTYEEDTLFKMRQAEFRRGKERRRLEEQIRLEDESGG